MTITVNGSTTEVGSGRTVLDLVASLDLPDRGIAVAVDGEVVPRSAWARTVIPDRARVEVVTPMQGG